MEATRAILDPLLPDAYSVAPDGTLVPDVLVGEAIVTADPFTVTYEIKEEAVWSDGTPVSAYDFRFTYKSFMNAGGTDPTGYQRIASAQIVDDKTITFTFRRPYPDYKTLFTDVVPRHLLIDKNLRRRSYRIWRRQIPISAGPFKFAEWERGSHLTLVRNDAYWGEHLAYLDEVTFTFMRRANRQVDALRAGDVDVIYPPLHPSLSTLYDLTAVEVQTASGPLWEHIAMQLSRGPTRRQFVREAIAYAIDREAIVDDLIRPIDPNARVLQNLLFSTGDPRYEPHFAVYGHEPARAESILQANGCIKGDDGVYRCGGRRLEVRYVRPTMNPIRREIAELIRADLAEVGIAVDVLRMSPSRAFVIFLPNPSRWELFNFGWIHRVRRLWEVDIWRCGGSSNYYKYCDEDASALLRAARHQPSPEERDELFDQADEIMVGDVPSLPLYQRPAVLAFDSGLDGLVVNPYEGPTWNIQEWSRSQ